MLQINDSRVIAAEAPPCIHPFSQRWLFYVKPAGHRTTSFAKASLAAAILLVVMTHKMKLYF